MKNLIRRHSLADGARLKMLARRRGEKRIAMAAQMLHVARERNRLELELAMWRTKKAQAEAGLRRLTLVEREARSVMDQIDPPKSKTRVTGKSGQRRRGKVGVSVIEY